MAKGIIVLTEIPNNCFCCRLKKRPAGMSFPEDMICGITGQSVYQYKPHNINGKKPDWCPIKQMPEKIEVLKYPHSMKFSRGWNACLNEVLGIDK